MKGKQPGRPTKWVEAAIREIVYVGKPGVRFAIWEKWKQKDRKFGTLIVSVGGLRFKAANGKVSKRKTWEDLANWMENQ